MTQIDRSAYAQMYGPTTGDRVRLGDTELWVRVEKDFTTYGEEVKFGGGKVIRDGMGQSQRTSKRFSGRSLGVFLKSQSWSWRRRRVIDARPGRRSPS